MKPSSTALSDKPCRTCGESEIYVKTGICAPCQRERVRRGRPAPVTTASPAALPGAATWPHELAPSDFSAFIERAAALARARYGADLTYPIPSGRGTARRTMRFDFLAHPEDYAVLVPAEVDPQTLPDATNSAGRILEAKVPAFNTMIQQLTRLRHGIPATVPMGPCVSRRRKQGTGPAPSSTLMVSYVAHADDVEALREWAACTWAPPSRKPLAPTGAIYFGPMGTPGPEVIPFEPGEGA